MSIRMLALELYKIMKEIEELKKKLREKSPAGSEREKLEDRLRVARAERDRLRAMLEGAKEA